MHTTRRLVRSSTTALALAGAIGLTVVAIGADDASAATAPAASCDSVQEPPAQLPAGVEDGDYVFVTQYRGLIVQLTCGRLELVEPTGWASCYFLFGDEVLGYPC
jgi:hypothetical protein